MEQSVDFQQPASKFLYKQETHQVLGCAMEVHNALGAGLNEKCYENAMVVEFKLNKIPFDQQATYDVVYKGVQVGRFIPDLVVFATIIVDAKTIDRINDYERAQMLNYLRITKLRVGLIINFKNPRLE
jgi:GxxExxY protein